MCQAAMKSGNSDTSKYLASLFWTHMGGYYRLGRSYNEPRPPTTAALHTLFDSVFRQDSEDLCKMWVNNLMSLPAHMQGAEIIKELSAMQCCIFREAAIRWTANQPARELYLLSVWAGVLRETKLDTSDLLGSALLHVARSTSSVNLAKWLVDRGANVDYRLSERYSTSLLAVAKKDSHQAALLSRFLLFRGADPTIRRRISYDTSKVNEFADPMDEEKGPRNISKWLGISWSELVAQATAANGSGCDTRADNQHNPDSEVEPTLTPFGQDGGQIEKVA